MYSDIIVIINDQQNDEYDITDKRKLNLVTHCTAYADYDNDGVYYLPLYILNS